MRSGADLRRIPNPDTNPNRNLQRSLVRTDRP